MIKRDIRILGLAILVAAGPGAFAAGPPPPSQAAVKLRIVDLAGTPYEMGRIHGRTLRAEIGELVGRWKHDLEATYHIPAGDFIKDFLKKTDFRPAIERWTPGLLD